MRKINHTRQVARPEVISRDKHLLVLHQDKKLANKLSQDLENRLPVNVSVAGTLAAAKKLLKEQPNKFFLAIAHLPSNNEDEFKKIDFFNKSNLPVIVLVDGYDDDLRDQLIKSHVIDYVVKGTNADANYICDLVARICKNVHTKVLVVDDSKVSRFVISRELSQQKFQVLEASNSLDALNMLAKEGDVKLVLVDYQMRSVDGIAFVKKARETYPKEQLVIIGISTSVETRLPVKFLKAGANDYISKPFNYEMILCRINQNLDMLDVVDMAKQLSHIDYLSNIYNRCYFFEQGNKVFNELAKNDVLTVAMVDIDDFKNINDLYGHDVGDEVIKDMAALLQSHFPNDIVARLGGEEFAVLSLSPKYADSFADFEKFRHRIATEALQIRSHVIQFTCSIGVVNTRGSTLDNMMVSADRLLYQAKENGRNRIEGTPCNQG